MLIPDAVRTCVVFVGHETRKGNVEVCGTAFLVGRELKGTEEYAVYCVTAKHVIDEIKARSGYQVWLRINSASGAPEWIATELHDWLYHPSRELVDVAAMAFDIDSSPFDLEMHTNRACPLSIAADNEKITQEAIGIGDEVVLVGLFSQHKGTKRNIPIVRVGNIAAMPEEPVCSKLGYMEAYLVEVRSIGGLSGSPVFVHLGITRSLDGKLKIGDSRNPKIFLLGLMHGHWDSTDSSSEDVIEDSFFKNEKLNMGIAIVVPMVKILEVLNQDEFKRAEEIKADRWRKAHLPTMD